MIIPPVSMKKLLKCPGSHIFKDNASEKCHQKNLPPLEISSVSVSRNQVIDYGDSHTASSINRAEWSV